MSSSHVTAFLGMVLILSLVFLKFIVVDACALILDLYILNFMRRELIYLEPGNVHKMRRVCSMYR